jgi:hypothetical protein
MLLWSKALFATFNNPQSDRANSLWAGLCQTLSVISHDYEFVVQALRDFLQGMQDQQPHRLALLNHFNRGRQDQQPQQTSAPKKRTGKASCKNDIGDAAPFPSIKMM